MELLMNAKEPEEVCWNLGRGSTTFSLPRQSVQINVFVQDCIFSDVKRFGQFFEMQQSTSDLQIRI